MTFSYKTMESYYRDIFDYTYYNGNATIAEVKDYLPYEFVAYAGIFMEHKKKEQQK